METMIELPKLTNTLAYVVVVPPVVQMIKGMALVGWGKLWDEFLWFNVHND
jgi:hypothetical protein